MDTFIGWVMAPLHQPKLRYSLEKLEWEQMSKNHWFTTQDSATISFLMVSTFSTPSRLNVGLCCAPYGSLLASVTALAILPCPPHRLGAPLGQGLYAPYLCIPVSCGAHQRGSNKHLSNEGVRLINCSFHKSWLRLFIGDIAPCRTIMREPTY